MRWNNQRAFNSARAEGGCVDAQVWLVVCRGKGGADIPQDAIQVRDLGFQPVLVWEGLGQTAHSASHVHGSGC